MGSLRTVWAESEQSPRTVHGIFPSPVQVHTVHLDWTWTELGLDSDLFGSNLTQKKS